MIMNRAIHVRACVAVVAAASLLLLSACGSSDPLSDKSSSSSKTIVVGSANFSESEIIADIYAGALKSAGVKVSTRLQIGARDAYIAALKDGSIDLVPEYTGNLLQYFDKTATAQSSDEVYAALVKATPSTFTVLDQAAAQDADSFNVTREFSAKHHVTSLTDLKGMTGLKVGAPPEFSTRPYGIPGLKSVYGVSATLVPINDGGGPTTLAALLDGKVQLADIYSTTPSIKQHHLVTLTDPKHMILAQNVVPLMAKGKASTKVTTVLDKVQAKLTTDGLIEMNTKSSIDKQSAQKIADAWLSENGF